VTDCDSRLGINEEALSHDGMIEVGMTDASEDGIVNEGTIEEGAVGDGVVVEATIDERSSGGTLYPSFGSSHCFRLRTVDLSPNASRVPFGAMVMSEEQNPRTPARSSPVRPRPDMTLCPDWRQNSLVSVNLVFAGESLKSRIKRSLGVDFDLEEVNAFDDRYRKGDEQE
jgi:hypothetical protein